MNFQQVYKSRAEAFRLFVVPENLPVKRAKFYDDCERCGLVSSDKSVTLAALMNYARDELKVSPVSATSENVSDSQREKERLEIRERSLKVEKLEREAERDAGKYVTRKNAELQLAALAGLLRDAVRYHFHQAAERLVEVCRGESDRSVDLYTEGEQIFGHAFNEVCNVEQVEIILADMAEDLDE